jgi:hypothetical protein
MELFGFEIKRRINRGEEENPEEEKKLKSFVPPTTDDGVATISAGGYYGQYYDIDGMDGGQSDREMILRYRSAAEQPETDNAIDDIINESITSHDVGMPISLNVDDLEFEEELKRKILNEFDTICNLFKIKEFGSDYFRKWYIDGKIYFHIVVDTENPKKGIQDLRYIDPINMRKVREVKKEVDKLTGITVTETVEEFFVYNEEPSGGITSVASADAISGIKVAPEAIIYQPSGLMDQSRTKVLSHLHKSIKIINQLRMLEDALVIYRISRAPERRIFYIDVGNLPKGRAEEYVRNMMSQYRNKIVYDASSGEVRDDRRHKSMLEDFFLPRREGGRGTEITTLPGGENLGQIDDILFFQKKLYKSLNVPLSRLDAESGFQVGRATEINREEVKFNKFIQRLRKKFSNILIEALKTQLILKGVINEDDWPGISENIFIDYLKDNYFAELKEFEIMRERFDMMGQVESFIESGYYSKEWVKKNILGQDDQEIDMIGKQIADENAEGENEDEFNDLSAGKIPEEEKGDLEKELNSSEGTLESQI